MMPRDGGESQFTFGPFQLDAASRVFSRFGQSIALPPKAFDLLLMLVENHGRVLSKSQLMAALWRGVNVEDANLSFQISTLRKALGEEGAAWIETAPKVGYRFSGPLERSAQPPSQPASAPSTGPRFSIWVAAVGAVVVLGITGWLARDRETPAPPL